MKCVCYSVLWPAEHADSAAVSVLATAEDALHVADWNHMFELLWEAEPELHVS